MYYVKEGPKVDSTTIELQYETCADVKMTAESDYVAGLLVYCLSSFNVLLALADCLR